MTLLLALICVISLLCAPNARAQSVTAAIPWNGWANNLAHPDWGATNTSAATLSRTLIPSAFADNVSIPVPSAAGSARAMVTALFTNASVAASVANVPRTAAWSAFASHLTELVYFDLVRLAPNVSDPWPMPVPACDPDWDELCLGGVTLPYFRAQAALTGPRGERAALNSATPYLDLEFLYGQSAAAATPLRSFTDGQLLLPNGYLQNTTTTSAQLLDDVLVPAGTMLFLAGDLRINKNPALAAMVTLLAREHNRRAAQLKAAGTFVTDDDLFANARRWTIAVWQHMVHDDFFSSILGAGLASFSYSNATNPAIDSFMAACALRFPLTGANQILYRVASDGTTASGGHVSLTTTSYDASALTRAGIDHVLRGLVVARESACGVSSPSDRALTLAQALHRSMDLGVPKYNAVRAALGLTPATSFASISSTPAVQAALAAMYPSVSSVDACVGAWAEDAKPYARVGTTFATAWQRQLLAVRNGDRFWYQNTLATADYFAVKKRVWASLVSEFTSIARFPQSVVEVVPDASSAFLNATTTTGNATATAGGSPVVKLTDGVWLNWTLSASSITFEATVTKSGWFAFAIGAGMPNFQDVALVTWVNGVPTIADAYTNGYAPAVDTTQPGGTSRLVLTYTKDALGRNHYVWTRPLLSTDPWDLNITNPSMPTSCSFALGTSPSASYHGALRGVIALTFNTTTTSTGGVTLPPPTTVVSTNWPLGVQLLHGAFMVSAFYGAIPLGVITARYLVNKKWLNQHIKFSMFVLSQVSVSIATAIIGANIDLLALPHGMIGVATMVLLMVATVSGALIAKELNASLRTYRLLRWSHIIVAMSAWGLGTYNCFLGLGIVVERNPDLEWLHWLLVFLTGFVAVIMASFEVWRIRNGKVMLKGLVKLNAAHAGAGHGAATSVAGAMFAEADDDHDKTMPEFTWDDINAKIADGSLWLVIEGVVYDITYFVNSHPGDDILRYVGTDASAAFEGMPAPRSASAAAGSKTDPSTHATAEASGTSTAAAPRRLSIAIRRRAGSSATLHDGNRRLHTHSRRARHKLATLAVGVLKEGGLGSHNVLTSHFDLSERPLRNDAPSWVPMTPRDARGLHATKFRPLKLIKKEQLTSPTSGAGAVFRFRFAFERASDVVWCVPGDAVVVQLVPVNGKVPRTRAYTPIAVHSKGVMDLLIKIYPQGGLTAELAKCNEGEFITIRGPIHASRPLLKSVPDPRHPGALIPDPKTSGCYSHLALISAGSGLTPMLLWIDYFLRFAPRDAATGDPSCKLTLLHQVSTADELVYTKELGEMRKQARGAITIRYFLSQGGNVPLHLQADAVPRKIALDDLRRYLPAPAARLPPTLTVTKTVATGSHTSLSASSTSAAAVPTAPAPRLDRIASALQALAAVAHLHPAAAAAAGGKRANAAATPAPGMRRRSSLAFTPLLQAESSAASEGRPTVVVEDEDAGGGRGKVGRPVAPDAPSCMVLVCGPAGFNTNLVEMLAELRYTGEEVMLL